MHFMAFAQQNGSLKSGDALKQKKPVDLATGFD